MPFPNTWNALQGNLEVGTIIPNWIVYSGLLGDSFAVVAVTPTYIEVDTPGAQNLQRVPITDFQVVYNCWNGYCQHAVPRHEIRDSTLFSKYIISILHWLENQVGVSCREICTLRQSWGVVIAAKQRYVTDK